MTTRVITVYSTQTNKRNDITTDVTTWGDLQEILSEKNITYSGMTATENRNKTNLELDAALLPEGNFTLFLSPNTKIKSGTDWKDMGYNEIRKYATSIGVSGLGTLSEICQRIENWEKTNNKKSSSDDILNSKFPTVAAKLDAFIAHTNANFHQLVDNVQDETYPPDYIPFDEEAASNDNLAEEAASLGLR